jgi:hypothetical protein
MQAYLPTLDVYFVTTHDDIRRDAIHVWSEPKDSCRVVA